VFANQMAATSFPEKNRKKKKKKKEKKSVL
jgi:hypothetical protein